MKEKITLFGHLNLEGCFCVSPVIVINRDLVLINAIIIVFLEASNLLCWFHINKNVRVKMQNVSQLC